MAGLGTRGKAKVGGANELFSKTEKHESRQNINTENHKNENIENMQPVKKSFVFSFALAEQLRKHAFEKRMKEVDIVREALDLYFKNAD
ncbi:hypothetical protein [Desulfovibrio falkowii]|uniref:Ribbon-helix-helix protein CopG domain-containing protein n=1 Tax=Desulfovibrio falkowii TaxID=3136602 RepID=A0ABQ0E5M7_9BACT